MYVDGHVMSESISELARRLVIGRKRDGRSIYDEQAKHELILACRQPGTSMAKLARECGVNANQLASWVRRYERTLTEAATPPGEVLDAQMAAFVAVQVESTVPAGVEREMSLQARLPNGVVLELRGCDLQQSSGLIEVLGRLRCSASSRG